IGQRRLAGECLYFLIELERVIARLRAEHPSTASKERVLDISCPCSAGTLLLFQFLGGSTDLLALLRLVCALALVGQIALHIKVDRMIVGFDAKHRIGQRHLAAGIFTTRFYN